MKNFITAIGVVFLVFVVGCKKECKLGYSGSNCREEIVKSYFGKYDGSLTSISGSWHDYFEVGTVSSSTTEMSIGAFKAVMENNNGKFYLPSQSVVINGQSYNVWGVAYFSRSGFDMNFTMERNGSYTDYFFTGIKTQ